MTAGEGAMEAEGKATDPRLGWKICDLSGVDGAREAHPNVPPWALRFTDLDERGRVRHRFVAEGIRGTSYDTQQMMADLLAALAQARQTADMLRGLVVQLAAAVTECHLGPEWNGIYHPQAECGWCDLLRAAALRRAAEATP